MNYKIELSSEEVPKKWYNINADLPCELPMPKNSEGRNQIEDLQKAFTKAALDQEFATERYIKIPQKVRELYMQMGRPTPLFRAKRLEEKLNTPAKIYYKREDTSPTGSHKLNSAIPQAYFAKKEGVERLTTETGAGQWGTALSLACSLLDLDCTVYDIVKKVFEADNPPEDIYFIMQYEAFLRYSGQPFYNESLRSLLYKPWFSAELIYEFKPSDFYPVPNARICFAHFQRKTSADVEDAIDYRNFLSYIFLASGNTFKDKTKKLFTYEQQKRICKFLKIKLESTLTEISYDGWLYLYDVFLEFVSNEKKAIILNAEQDMKNNQNKIQKKHRNRNHGYWKFEAKRQKKLKFENGK